VLRVTEEQTGRDGDGSRYDGGRNPRRPAPAPEAPLVRATPASVLEMLRSRAQWVSSGRGQRRPAVRGRASLAAAEIMSVP
jgi:hypothetical protein